MRGAQPSSHDCVCGKQAQENIFIGDSCEPWWEADLVGKGDIRMDKGQEL